MKTPMKTARIEIRVTVKEKRAIEKAARRYKKTVSEYIRSVLRFDGSWMA